ncbi:cytochrome P450 7B1 isoform X1 [Syngnathus acus]|uniref:cytochrome P450 7B1 isoform X1 n=1 Tax=Syngnathus acus TaxID=161584 RepID=UPI0018863B54|nr:cytochrome P450 7B1 isoform X1 [Syngnathus acus]
MFTPLACALLLVVVALVPVVIRRHRRKRCEGEPPLIDGWIPFLGKALEFRKDAHKFLEEQRKNFGDVFTIHMAGRYMTFIMDPLMYPAVIKEGRRLDFHEFSGRAAPAAFGYPRITEGTFPGLAEQIERAYGLLRGEQLTALTQSMMGNLMTLFRQDHLKPGATWRERGLYDFCLDVMLEATFLTLYGRPAQGSRHTHAAQLKTHFVHFDEAFPLLIAQVPAWLLGRARAARRKLTDYLAAPGMSDWADASLFIRRRAQLLEGHPVMGDADKAAHHLAMLWASVANTAPAAFWATYHLLRHPEALRAVRQEILEVLERSGRGFSDDMDLALAAEQLDHMILLGRKPAAAVASHARLTCRWSSESTVHESLRMSSASINIRVAQEDLNLRLDAERVVAVRRGDIVALYPRSVHMDAGIYEQPQAFRFDRFAHQTEFFKDGQKLRHYLMPFGSGASICPGRFFAVNEIKQVVCLLLLYFDLRLEAGQPDPRPDGSRAGLGIPRPDQDVRFQYRLRSAVAR